ncbi:MAG: hypothetical protein USCGTAYLOR_02706 [Chromatiales bacterium USCg_Taylor]|nr:MAG: hypothetical protein USCGTAYLOR_02706 [Chromatiales bacterium USCg_Taylor]
MFNLSTAPLKRTDSGSRISICVEQSRFRRRIGTSAGPGKPWSLNAIHEGQRQLHVGTDAGCRLPRYRVSVQDRGIFRPFIGPSTKFQDLCCLARPRAIRGCRLRDLNQVGCSFRIRRLDRAKCRAGDRGGARACKPRGVRILAITLGSSIAVMIFKVPPQWAVFQVDIEHPFEQLGPTDAAWHRGKGCVVR